MPDKFFALTLALAAMQGANLCVLERVIYDLLMRCGWKMEYTFSQNDKPLYGTPSAICSAAFELDK